MLTAKLKQLKTARATVATLEKEIQVVLRAELAMLPAQYGFDSTQAFIAAVLAASSSKNKPVPETRGPRKRRRGKITDATRAELKKLVKTGKTGREIAAALKISLASVHNVKKELGLVRAS